MSYVLADSTGVLDEFASIGGLDDLRTFADDHPGPLTKFLRVGYTEDMFELAENLNDLQAEGSVADTLAVLRRVAPTAQDVLILSDGMSSDEEPRAAGSAKSGNFGHTGGAGGKGHPGGSGARDKFGKKYIIGSYTADEMRAEGLPPTLQAVEDKIRLEPFEHGFVVRDGKPVAYFGQNNLAGIQLPEDKNIRGPLFNNAVFTHNHPRNSALSFDDMETAIDNHMEEIRAVANDGSFSMKRLGEDWPPKQVFWRTANEVDDEVKNEFSQKIKDKTMTEDQANTAHYAEVWKRTSDRVNKSFPKDPFDKIPGGPTYPIQFSFEPRS